MKKTATSSSGKLKEGDLVRSITGQGPVMWVTEADEDLWVNTQWFDTTWTLQDGTFQKGWLVKVNL